MQLTAFLRLPCWVLFALLIATSSAGEPPPRPPADADEQRLDDILGTLVVEAGAPKAVGRRLLRVAVEPSLSPDTVDVIAHAVMQRDLELSGEVELLSTARFPKGEYASPEFPVLKAWRATGIEALVRVQGHTTSNGEAHIDATVFLLDETHPRPHGVGPSAPSRNPRLTAHRVADSVLGVLTGYDGGFASQLTFTLTVGHRRQAYVLDADGQRLQHVAKQHDLVSATAFGPEHQVYHAASVAHGAYRLYRDDETRPLNVRPSGSIYGIAFDPARNRMALALATGNSVQIFAGPADTRQLLRASHTEMALSPSFSSTGKLAYVGIFGRSHRIYVDGLAVSPGGLQASAPVFCAHPNGTRLVYSLGAGKRTDLVASDERGGLLQRLTRGPGSNRYPACSPDGRLLAFFSTRQSHEGPGLYLMSLQGSRPQKISSFVGDTLRWARVPPDAS